MLIKASPTTRHDLPSAQDGGPGGPDSEQNYHPSCGSIAAEQLRHLNPALPTYVMIPKMVPGTNSAYLDAACRPFETQSDPAKVRVGEFRVENLGLPEGLSVGRFLDRGKLLESTWIECGARPIRIRPWTRWTNKCLVSL